MSDGEKRYQPSDLKLERLRRDGVMPFSMDVLTFAAILGFFIGCAALFNSLSSEIIARCRDAWEAGGFAAESAVSTGAGIVTALRGVLFLTSAVLLPVFILVLLSGTLQTRFFFGFSALRPQWSALFQLHRLSLAEMGRRFGLAILSLCKVSLWLGLAVLAFLSLFLPIFPEGLPASRRASGVISQQVTGSSPAFAGELVRYKEQLVVLAAAALGAAFFIGVLSRIASVLYFQYQHRMSRAELEAEYRESEPAPEVRDAQREFGLEEPGQ